jgi:hypothetical protein
MDVLAAGVFFVAHPFSVGPGAGGTAVQVVRRGLFQKI